MVVIVVATAAEYVHQSHLPSWLPRTPSSAKRWMQCNCHVVCPYNSLRRPTKLVSILPFSISATFSTLAGSLEVVRIDSVAYATLGQFTMHQLSCHDWSQASWVHVKLDRQCGEQS